MCCWESQPSILDVFQRCHCDRQLSFTAVCHAGQFLKNGPSVAIVAQASLVYSSVHTAIDHPSSIIMSHSKAAKAVTHKLTPEQHERAMLLGLDYLKATTKSKFVYIRDELAKIFKHRGAIE